MNRPLIFFGIALLASCHSYVLNEKTSPQHQTAVNDVEPEYRKRLSNSRFEVMPRVKDSKEIADDLAARTTSKRGLESVLISLDTGAMREQKNIKHSLDSIDQIEKVLTDASSNRKGPFYRAQQEYDIKPEIVHLRASEKPSLKFEINTGSVIKALDKLLASPIVRRYAESLGRQAAILFNALSEDAGETASDSDNFDRRHQHRSSRPEYRRGKH